jgi:hypothetical protein
LLADFTAGGATRPDVPGVVAGALVRTTEDRWVVWAHKIAQPVGRGFVPLNPRGGWYPRVAIARCWRGGSHAAPDPLCTCGFHALTSPDGLPAGRGFERLEVALSGRILAVEFRTGVLYRAAEQAVLRIDPRRPGGPLHLRPATTGGPADLVGRQSGPGDGDGDRIRRRSTTPRGSGPVRLALPSDPPTIVGVEDDAGLCGLAGPSPVSAPDRARALVPA